MSVDPSPVVVCEIHDRQKTSLPVGPVQKTKVAAPSIFKTALDRVLSSIVLEETLFCPQFPRIAGAVSGPAFCFFLDSNL